MEFIPILSRAPGAVDRLYPEFAIVHLNRKARKDREEKPLIFANFALFAVKKVFAVVAMKIHFYHQA